MQVLCVRDNRGKQDRRSVISNRYKNLCPSRIKLVAKALEFEEAFTFFVKKFVGLDVQLEKFKGASTSTVNEKVGCTRSLSHIDHEQDGTIDQGGNNFPIVAKGIKTSRTTFRSKGRPKSGLEKRETKKQRKNA